MSEAKYLGLTANQLAKVAGDLDAENERLLSMRDVWQANDASLRHLIRDMWHGMCVYDHDCWGCEHLEVTEWEGEVRTARAECEYHRRMRELGVVE